MYFESQEKNKEDKNRSITPWWDTISDMELKRQEILPLQFYYDDIDIKILHYATSSNVLRANYPTLQV